MPSMQAVLSRQLLILGVLNIKKKKEISVVTEQYQFKDDNL